MHNDGITISIYQFLKRFPDEATARSYLEDRRWHGAPVCPYCENDHKIQERKNGPSCQKDFTVRVRTIFERSHVPLDKWLFAMYLLATVRKGISSLQLSKENGVTQKTAWFMLQRLREACGNGHDGLLSGLIEADETYIGGKEANKHENKELHAGRVAIGKVAVLGFRERGSSLKNKVITGTSAKVIHSAVVNSVEPGTLLYTDEHAAYSGLEQYNHQTVIHSAKEYVNGIVHTNGIESVWAVLKRGYYGVYHSFSTKHLQRYVNEFSFRLNEGNCRVHSWDRIEALVSKSIGVGLTYLALVGTR